MLGRTISFALLLATLLPTSAYAQTDSPQPIDASNESMDEEARALFQAGSTAFADGRWDDALDHFKRAYELSGRVALLYNIGITADRLRRDDEALEALQRFVAEGPPDHPRMRDAQARVAVLERQAAERAAHGTPTDDGSTGGTENTGNDGDGSVSRAAEPRDDGPGALAIVGPVALGVVGLAGVTAAIIGIAGAGGCVDMVGTTCVEEQQTNWVGVGVYGGLGLAAVAGAIVWLIVGLSSGGDEETMARLFPGGVGLGWSL